VPRIEPLKLQVNLHLLSITTLKLIGLHMAKGKAFPKKEAKKAKKVKDKDKDGK
jgi:hypothetical protein